ncbi:MAG: hypothetical protein KDK22_03040 [Rhodobacteraceae bacterium]|nr:hypothetical protein [Paracoccaceae bacterium]MCB1408568.1 hypothetical protein [Paracoccaceae bacterium]
MGWLGRRQAVATAPETGVVLDLSGPRLRRAFQDLAASAEPTGGVSRYVTALMLKSALFQELLGQGAVRDLSPAAFLDLAAFIAPVRRRIGAALAEEGFERIKLALMHLLDGDPGAGPVDDRLRVFCAAFPQDKAHRWVRDLGAEVLHFTDPERIPLMTRWIWDARVGTGALREIWHADDVDLARIDADDGQRSFDTLSVELIGFLASEGVYRDLPFAVDLLLAHVYAGYINDRGGQYLRSDFTSDTDPMHHTRRMLGLDAVDTETGRTRLRLIDGKPHVLSGLPDPEVSNAHS